MLNASKRYRVTAEFGVATDSGDATGAVIEQRATGAPSARDLELALGKFRGQILQTPPMYSALKQNGRRLYELARAGQTVERTPRPIEIFAITVETLAWPRLTLDVHCSKGTYIRSLVIDLAVELSAVALVQALRRTGVGPYAESQMISVESLEHAASAGLETLDRYLLPIDSALQDRPAVTVDAANALALRQGRKVRVSCEVAGPSVRIYDPVGTLVGLGELTNSGELKPSCIFPP
jgi:tRNA pseudouridine55 synthase